MSSSDKNEQKKYFQSSKSQKHSLSSSSILENRSKKSKSFSDDANEDDDDDEVDEDQLSHLVDGTCNSNNKYEFRFEVKYIFFMLFRLIYIAFKCEKKNKLSQRRNVQDDG